MKRVLAIATVIGAALAGSAAIAHSPPDPEPQRVCSPYRPNGVVPTMSPVEARKDAEGNNYTGVCTKYGVVRAGTQGNGVFVAADGDYDADPFPPAEQPEQLHWGRGYVLVTADPSNGPHVYCAGGGQYENGDQVDDEYGPGDCGRTGLEPSPEPIPSDLPTPSPEPSPSETPTPEPSPSETPTPEPSP